MDRDATQLLTRLARGDAAAADQLLTVVYEELRRLAAGYLQHERAGHTLQPTALVHEAFFKLVGHVPAECTSRAHFFGVAARAMRQVLVDHARRHRAVKRGGEAVRWTLDDLAGVTSGNVLDLIALDEALVKLAALDERQSQVVELRFFAGLTAREAATALGVSLSTIECDWRLARAWLHRELCEGGLS